MLLRPFVRLFPGGIYERDPWMGSGPRIAWALAVRDRSSLCHSRNGIGPPYRSAEHTAVGAGGFLSKPDGPGSRGPPETRSRNWAPNMAAAPPRTQYENAVKPLTGVKEKASKPLATHSVLYSTVQ